MTIMGITQMKVVIRGGGDIGSGVAWRLYQCGFKLIITEIENPLCVRRKVSFCEAVYLGRTIVQGVEGVLIHTPDSLNEVWSRGAVPVIVDPDCHIKEHINCHVLVDCIMAKRNTGTGINDAPLVIGVGPGFVAGEDVHYVVETKRGHDLGRLLLSGVAAPDSGVPGPVMGITTDRVLRAPCNGIWQAQKEIGDYLKTGDLVGRVNGREVRSRIDGILRGLLKSDIMVKEGLKIGDVDPRGIKEYCYTISDKCLAIAGGVLEGILREYKA